jgi:toxin ParE1/3/4
MKIAYSPRAIRDLRNISAYLKPRSLLGPNNVRVAILTSIYQLSIFPEAGAPQNTQGVRKIITRKYPYLIYYTIDHGADEILVITIQHAAQQREFTDQ